MEFVSEAGLQYWLSSGADVISLNIEPSVFNSSDPVVGRQQRQAMLDRLFGPGQTFTDFQYLLLDGSLGAGQLNFYPCYDNETFPFDPRFLHSWSQAELYLGPLSYLRVLAIAGLRIPDLTTYHQLVLDILEEFVAFTDRLLSQDEGAWVLFNGVMQGCLGPRSCQLGPRPIPEMWLPELVNS